MKNNDDEIVVSVEVDKSEIKKRKKEKKKKYGKMAKGIRTEEPLNKKKRLSRIKNMIIFIFFIIIIIFILKSGIFNIKNIEVSGNSNLSKERIITLSGITDADNLFELNKKSISSKLKENAYIESVRISKKMPDTICIDVVEREPTYILQFSDSYVYINNQGYLLEVSNEKANVPIILGFTTDLNNMTAGNRLNEEDLNTMNSIIKLCDVAKNNEMGDYITKIDISDKSNYIIEMESKGKRVNLGDCSNYSNLNTKMLYLYSILQTTENKREEIFLNVDLNKGKVYSRPIS